MAEKTALTSAVEGFVGGLLHSAAQNASNQNPPPKMAEDGQPITPQSIIEQLQKQLDHDPIAAMRLALTLGALIGRQAGVTEKNALIFAGLAWAQTSQLTTGPRNG